MGKLTIAKDQFLYDGKPMRILSGAIHYFRVVPEYWKDRLQKLKACGFNTVETYVPWNLHEPRPGEFCFDAGLDIEKFIRTAQELGLFVIVRPGPYICAEWEFGGLPAWLLKDPAMQLRCGYKPYLDAIDRYFDELIGRLVPLQSTNGGPIIAIQVENEYGSYGNDHEYLQYIEKGLKSRGVDVLLFTSDGACDSMLQGGTLPHIFKTVNFGSRALEQFEKLKEFQPEGPLMCMEYWNGWFDHWGEEHHSRDGQDVADVLDEMLSMGASVNFYMFHGGTNFGFMNGANCMGEYQPTVTSYDYDAPLSECGDPTEKFYAVQKVIKKYANVEDVPLDILPKMAYGTVELNEYAKLFDSLDDIGKEFKRPAPVPMEMLDQNYGFILYRTFIAGPRDESPLILQDVRDRALVFVDDQFAGVIYRDDKEPSIYIKVPKEGIKLDILVENMGRTNYGPNMLDRKGITYGVRMGQQFIYNWTIYTLEMDNLHKLNFNKDKQIECPAFYRGEFEVAKPFDTFLKLSGWTKGVCYINGFNLGRYWNAGPQQTLYIPGPLLNKGKNELIIFELENVEKPIVELIDQPLL